MDQSLDSFYFVCPSISSDNSPSILSLICMQMTPLFMQQRAHEPFVTIKDFLIICFWVRVKLTHKHVILLYQAFLSFDHGHMDPCIDPLTMRLDSNPLHLLNPKKEQCFVIPFILSVDLILKATAFCSLYPGSMYPEKVLWENLRALFMPHWSLPRSQSYRPGWSQLALPFSCVTKSLPPKVNF